MTPIVNSDKPEEAADPAADIEASGQPVDLGALATLLQLPTTATIDEIYQAVSDLLDSKTELKLKADAIEFGAYKQRVETAVEVAMKEGKVTPAQKDWAYRNAMTDLDEFLIWCKGASPIIPLGQIVTSFKSSRRDVSRSDELLGLSHEDVRRFGGGPTNAL